MDEDQYPKGAGRQAPDAIVQIVMDEKRARQVEEQFLRPRGIMLAGPMLFGPDDAPSYILSPVDPRTGVEASDSAGGVA